MYITSSEEDEKFCIELWNHLDNDTSWVLEWVRNNFSPKQVFPEDELKSTIRCSFYPEDIFSRDELYQWARANFDENEE